MLIKLTLTTGDAQLVNTNEIISARPAGDCSFVQTRQHAKMPPFGFEVKEDLDEIQTLEQDAHYDPYLVSAARRMLERASTPWMVLDPDKALPETIDGKPVEHVRPERTAKDQSAGDDPDPLPFRLDAEPDGPAESQPAAPPIDTGSDPEPAAQ